MNFSQHLTVPHSASIPFQLSEGKEIIVNGTVAHHCQRFSIYLCTGPNSDSDVPLVFNPRFDQGTVVRNHKQQGNWGPEELHGGLPFRKGHHYQVKIAVKHHTYQIFIDNVHFCDFNHRMSKEMVRFVYVEGDTQLNAVQFQDASAMSMFPNPPVPFTTPIHGGAQPGRVIYVDGIPRNGASRFSLNLLCGPNPEYDDISLTFDVRFNYGDNYNVVVRNHKAMGNWGSEERHQTYFPFAYNAPFSIMVLIEHQAIKIAVNNQHFTEFQHRVHPVHRINHVNVQGDVTLTNVRVQ